MLLMISNVIYYENLDTLHCVKRMDSDNYSDIVVGRLEAISMIEKDKYSLLY